MLSLRHQSFELAFQYPFTTHKGTKTQQPTLVVGLGLGPMMGFGEAPAINYYNVNMAEMQASLEAKRAIIESYALTDPKRFWHFLHHLIPGQHFLTAALDIAAWDLFAQMRRKPLYSLLGLNFISKPITDYTIGIDTNQAMMAKVQSHPWPIYKIKLDKPDDMDLLRSLRKITTSAFRIDMNEGWQFEDVKRCLSEMKELGVTLIEQPLLRAEIEAMKELKAISDIDLFADESCRTEDEVIKCADGFHGINIKLTKCGGITPAIRMIEHARKLGLKVMLGSMNESTIGTTAIVHLWPLVDALDADGPLLLKEDIAEGLSFNEGYINLSASNGLGIKFGGYKRERQII
jgi:L-Ala-D/L-Glu epimerase